MSSDNDTSTLIKHDEKIKIEIHEPKRWNVIFLNDDQTPMEFVISLLIEVYGHSGEKAQAITLTIHEKGSDIAGTYSFEIAEVKAVETTNLARASGFPLQVKLEEE
ncbi:MAG: ATP-dependent Clp protease adaptor ClpS [Actinobacteria bacterium]|nr:ATP-dependent Clp protease adaptor ClpS [Actinomycetota bacterium]